MRRREEEKGYKVRYNLREREIEIEWEEEFKVSEESSNYVRYVDRYRVNEIEDRVIRLLSNGKEHYIGEIEREVYGEKGETQEQGIIALINGINIKIKRSRINKGKEESVKVIERARYGRYKIIAKIEVW